MAVRPTILFHFAFCKSLAGSAERPAFAVIAGNHNITGWSVSPEDSRMSDEELLCDDRIQHGIIPQPVQPQVQELQQHHPVQEGVAMDGLTSLACRCGAGKKFEIFRTETIVPYVNLIHVTLRMRKI